MSQLQIHDDELSLEKYRELADLHHQMREYFSSISERATQLGAEPATYELLLAIEGLPEAAPPTFAEIAARMCMPAEAVAAAIQQAVARGEIITSAVGNGWVKLTRKGRELLRSIAVPEYEEMPHRGSGLLRPLQLLLKRNRANSRPARREIVDDTAVRQPGARTA